MNYGFLSSGVSCIELFIVSHQYRVLSFHISSVTISSTNMSSFYFLLKSNISVPLPYLYVHRPTLRYAKYVIHDTMRI
jgi:hypothetical protein